MSSHGLPVGNWGHLSHAGMSFVLFVFKLGVAVMKFRNPPVNCLSLELLTELVISLEKLENDKTFRGVILTSVSAPKLPARPQAQKALHTHHRLEKTQAAQVLVKSQAFRDHNPGCDEGARLWAAAGS